MDDRNRSDYDWDADVEGVVVIKVSTIAVGDETIVSRDEFSVGPGERATPVEGAVDAAAITYRLPAGGLTEDARRALVGASTVEVHVAPGEDASSLIREVRRWCPDAALVMDKGSRIRVDEDVPANNRRLVIG